MAEVLTEKMWQAIVRCDPAYDGAFYYGVATTGIFCRPSCKSRTPTRENIRVFRNVPEALTQRFRPCKRCRPDGLRLPDEEWTDHIAEWLREHYAEPITLERLADTFHAGPFHLQRTFKKVQRVSPAFYLQEIRIAKAQQLLQDPRQLPIAEIAASVGIGNAAHFATLFHKTTGLTPSQYRARKADVTYETT